MECSNNLVQYKIILSLYNVNKKHSSQLPVTRVGHTCIWELQNRWPCLVSRASYILSHDCVGASNTSLLILCWLPIQKVKCHLTCFPETALIPSRVGKLWPSAIFVNKVVLEHSHAHLFVFIYGCFPTTVADLSSCDKDHMVQYFRLHMRNPFWNFSANRSLSPSLWDLPGPRDPSAQLSWRTCWSALHLLVAENCFFPLSKHVEWNLFPWHKNTLGALWCLVVALYVIMTGS